HPEALSWVQDYLRTKRDYPTLRDVLLAAARATDESPEGRKDRLREVASLCESNLRDMDGAIGAYKQLLSIDRNDENARQALTRILEKAQRWDDLANLLEQEAAAETDIEKKITLEKKVASLHEGKRRDLLSAAEAWERISNLTPDDDQAIATAAKAFEKAGAVDRAANVIATNAGSVTDAESRAALNDKLGALREKLRDLAGAGEAYAEAADGLRSQKLWEAAERCFVAAELWDRSGEVAVQRAHLEEDLKARAKHFGRAAELFRRFGDDANVVANLQLATELDPTAEAFAQQLSTHYRETSRWTELVDFLLRHASHLSDKARRVAARRQAAQLYTNEIGDKDAAREAWRKVLEDGDDPEALERLIDDAVEREDFGEATGLLRRLEATAPDKVEKAQIALREAELQAEGVGDVVVAIDHYERILKELDPTCRPALQAIADLQEAGDNPKAAAQALERELALVPDAAERAPIAGRLANLYEQLGDLKSAVKALEVVRKADPDDFDALARLCDLCEKIEEWAKVAELLAQRIEIEADDAEMSVLSRKLSSVLMDKLERGDEALAVLNELADQGDPDVREAYVALGDKLGWRGIVAAKLVAWWLDAKASPERVSNLRGAFDRFAEVGRDEDAIKVGCEVIKSKGGDKELADRLEQLSIKLHDLDAVSVAHDFLVREMSGAERAAELVRQAEARVLAGAPRAEALQHGETGLTSVAPGESEELLVRLSAIAETPTEVVDLYERQISRCKAAPDRVDALARAAQVAASKNQIDRARGFFDLALSGTPTDEALEALEDAAGEGDVELGGDGLRRALCAAMANGGQGSRDGGRTRGALLRRAALIAYRDLEDIDQAFAWLGDALIAYVEAPTLDALEGLANQLGEPQRAEATLSRALAEVFDGPLVRQLLARRAKLRRDALSDKLGAAADLKRLYELSPHEPSVMADLSALLTELRDHRAIVQVFEDQILRGKDMTARAELARKVARMWEQELSDPREAADAWRRVLRMKQGDGEATAGLERAKANMLKKPPPSLEAALDAAEQGSEPAPVIHTPAPMRAPEREPEPEPEPQGEDESGPVSRPSATEDAPLAASNDDEPEPDEAATAAEAERDREYDPDATPLPAELPAPRLYKPMADLPAAGHARAAESGGLPIDVDSAARLEGDDAAEEIDVDMDVEEAPPEETEEKQPAPPKRTVPPPLPRS
ncbi:MAG TPA: hypothetical protein VKU41_27820, partial [Polyangiaceae bacterium]|nr:hypothetical protein [Polyangiaceae bacterium]